MEEFPEAFLCINILTIFVNIKASWYKTDVLHRFAGRACVISACILLLFIKMLWPSFKIAWFIPGWSILFEAKSERLPLFLSEYSLIRIFLGICTLYRIKESVHKACSLQASFETSWRKSVSRLSNWPKCIQRQERTIMVVFIYHRTIAWSSGRALYSLLAQ